MTDTFTTTADDVLAGQDLTGKTYIVTGASGGLGLATSEGLARAGADLVLVGRDWAKLDAARTAVGAVGAGSVATEVADIADLESVAALAAKITASTATVDGLILNAGIMAAPLERTPQGHEMQLAVSYLGHAALAAALVDTLKLSKGRVVTLTSSGHWLGGYDFDDPDFLERDYEPWPAYGQAKTATALLAIAIAETYGAEGVTAAAVHPGVIKTDLQRHLSAEEETAVLAMSAEQGEVRTVEAGAASIVWAATAAEVAANNGCYVANAAIANELRAPHASDPDDAVRLWRATAASLEV